MEFIFGGVVLELQNFEAVSIFLVYLLDACLLYFLLFSLDWCLLPECRFSVIVRFC
jgi:hypothetical protein